MGSQSTLLQAHPYAQPLLGLSTPTYSPALGSCIPEILPRRGISSFQHCSPPSSKYQRREGLGGSDSLNHHKSGNLSDFEELGPVPTKPKSVEARATLGECVQGLVLKILVPLLYKGQRSLLGYLGLLPPVSCSSRRDISHCSDMGPCPGEANGKQQEA